MSEQSAEQRVAAIRSRVNADVNKGRWPESQFLLGQLEEAKEFNNRTYCTYCGAEFPVDGDGSLVTEHILVCLDHPIAKLQARNERLGEALKFAEQYIHDWEGYSRYAKELEGSL